MKYLLIIFKCNYNSKLLLLIPTNNKCDKRTDYNSGIQK